MSVHVLSSKDLKQCANVLLSGLTRSGKSMGAVLIAKGLGEKIGIVDTEGGASVDACRNTGVEARIVPLTESYLDAIDTLINEGCKTIVIDSISDEWNGVGGILQGVGLEQKNGKTTQQAWFKYTPVHDKFIKNIAHRTDINFISTCRMKPNYLKKETSEGIINTEYKGLIPEQRDSSIAHFRTLINLAQENNVATVKGDRSNVFAKGEKFVITEETGKKIRDFTTNQKGVYSKAFLANQHAIAIRNWMLENNIRATWSKVLETLKVKDETEITETHLQVLQRKK